MPVRFNKKTHTWFFRFSKDKSSHFNGGFRTQEQAKKAERNKQDEVEYKKQHPEREGDDLSFSDGAKWFFEKHSVIKKRSWKTDRGRLKVMVEFFGEKKLKDVTPDDVSMLREHLKKRGICAHTINHYHDLLRAVYYRLKKHDHYSGDNPAPKVEKEKVPRARTRFLYPSEEKILTPAVRENQRLWPYYVVALHSGMRISEICNIRVKDISIAGGTIFVPNSKASRSRHVPVSNELSSFLGSMIETKNPEDYALGGLGQQWVQRSLKGICEKVGISDFTWHDLRHTTAQRLLTKGVPIFKVMKILGHSSVVVTEQHYGHLALTDLKSAVDEIDGVLSLGCTQVALDDKLHQAINA